MRTKFLIILSVLLICASGCKLDDDFNPINCTEQFVFGINVTLIDATTSNKIITGVTLSIKDGDYEEILMTHDSIDSFWGAGERPGNYIITVTSNDYQTYVSDPIQVLSDECHVITEIVEITLQPN
ncbi:hypothetical protein [uncultured Wocania sp.]|uniref:hypothetical protein n=1 Tax=uncultured Wocania sp. TaxID=2834404 RepID=UPI0030F7991C